jgi:hypothetical protein
MDDNPLTSSWHSHDKLTQAEHIEYDQFMQNPSRQVQLEQTSLVEALTLG